MLYFALSLHFKVVVSSVFDRAFIIRNSFLYFNESKEIFQKIAIYIYWKVPRCGTTHNCDNHSESCTFNFQGSGKLLCEMKKCRKKRKGFVRQFTNSSYPYTLFHLYVIGNWEGRPPQAWLRHLFSLYISFLCVNNVCSMQFRAHPDWKKNPKQEWNYNCKDPFLTSGK